MGFLNVSYQFLLLSSGGKCLTPLARERTVGHLDSSVIRRSCDLRKHRGNVAKTEPTTCTHLHIALTGDALNRRAGITGYGCSA